MSYKLIETHRDETCSETDVLVNNERIAYFNHYVKDSENNDCNIFEVYYDFDAEYDEFSSSYVFDTYQDMIDFIESEIV